MGNITHMADAHAKKRGPPRIKPPTPTTAELLECIQSCDLGTKVGKKTLWQYVRRIGPYRASEYENRRDRYREQGFSVGDSNRLAALDLAAELPTAHEVPAGLIESLRPGTLEPVELKQEVATAQASEQAEQPKPPVPRHGIATKTQFDRLRNKVEQNCKGHRYRLAQRLAWVSAHLRHGLENLDADEVPGLEALTLWQWAASNETSYRSLYDAKRIPARGIVEEDDKGFIDDGGPIDDIMCRIETRSVSDVSMRHLQAADEDGNDHVPGAGGCGVHEGGDGGVHDLPEPPDERRAGGDSGGSETFGPGSGSDEGAGADIQGPGGEDARAVAELADTNAFGGVAGDAGVVAPAASDVSTCTIP